MNSKIEYKKVADVIADTLYKQGVRQVFGITGAGNIQIFDALARHGGFKLVFTHHEQSAVMAANTFFRTSGNLAVALVTTGGGSTNAITGVASANMDSVPVLVLAGNEPSRYISEENQLRVWGIQGFDSVKVLDPISKKARRLTDATEIKSELELSIQECLEGKQGVVWLEIPLDIQSMRAPSQKPLTLPTRKELRAPKVQIDSIINALQKSKRPLLWLGYGVRSSGAATLVDDLLAKLKVPVLLSWAAKDLIQTEHELLVGSAGVYGQRHANLILQASDYVLAIGTRLAIPQIGYSIEELAPFARIDLVDIEEVELEKFGNRITEKVHSDARIFIEDIIKSNHDLSNAKYESWRKHISSVMQKFPLIAAEHEDTPGFINSYKVIKQLNEYFPENSIIVTDMGTALLSGFYGVEIRGNQRIMTSTGLGEMGFGLPGSIGAAIASPEKTIICLNADGGMMMNLQELQTIVHHDLNIKIFIFNNDGYLMIKRSQMALLGGRLVGVDSNSGVSCPDFSQIAKAFGIRDYKISSWQDFNETLHTLISESGPSIIEIQMDPTQAFLPRLMTSSLNDGTLVSPPLEDLFPLVALQDLEWALMREANERSKQIRKDL